MLGIKTRPFTLGPQPIMITYSFSEHTILRRKRVFLGTQKFAKNMLRRSILISLFFLKNNRAMREQNNIISEGKKGTGNWRVFLQGVVMGGTGNWRGFLQGVVMGGTGNWRGFSQRVAMGGTGNWRGFLQRVVMCGTGN